MRILVLALSGIGDALMFTPSLKIIKQKNPDAVIDALVMFRGAEQFYSKLSEINVVHYHDFIRSNKLKSLSFVLSLRKKYDITFNVYPSNRREYNIINFLIGAKKRVGFNYLRKNFINLGFLNNLRITEDDNLHNVEENVRITRTVCDVAHALNIGCEGEIGKIGGTEDDITVDEADAMITTVEEALDFSTRTTVDYLAVSIGTAHGVYKTTPKLNFERLVEIKNAVQKPIVLHGGSGVPDDQIVEAISCGVAKINVDTELRQSFTKGVQAHWAANPDDFVLADSLGAGVETMKETVKQKIRLFGASGKA